MRPGWGVRHPGLVELLERQLPAARQDTAWANGTVPLRVGAYPEAVELPDELVRSVRCIVRVRDLIVVCTNTDGVSHPWPGGRREPGESFVETACREVHEETGWLVDPASLRQLGWLHLEHLDRRPDDWPYPHPDFLQVVLVGTAHHRHGGETNPWTDTEGYEASSTLMHPEDAAKVVDGDPLSRVFLELLT